MTNLNAVFSRLVIMTNKKAILGISLAAIFAVTMIASQTVSADEHFLDVEKLEMEMNSEAITQAKLKTGDIPATDETSWFGYVVLTNHGDWLAATTHEGFCDSEVQTDKGSVPSLGDADACPGDWHIHMVTPAAEPNAACVDEDKNPNGLAVGRISWEENGELDIDDNTVEFSDASRGELSLKNVVGADPEVFELGQPDGVVASFEIRPEFVDNDAPTIGTLLGVCLDVTDALEPYKFEGEDGK